MDAILNILKFLGMNDTIYPQFAIFIVTFVFLNHLVFKPYLNAYLERRKRTVGSQDVAKEILADIESRDAQYSKEAKEINARIKVVFDEKKTLATKESNAIIADAQSTAQEKIATGKRELSEIYSKAKDQMKSFVPEIGQAIKQRLLDR